MRILLVSSNFRPRIGGIERFTEILAVGLGRRGHEVAVVCCRSEDAPLREDFADFEVERIPAWYGLDRALKLPYPVPEPVHLVRSLRSRVARADVIHVQDVLYPTSLPALALAKWCRRASVLTQHVGFVPQASPLVDALERAALSTVGRCVRLADAVTTVNPAVALWVERQWGLRGVRALPIGVPPPPQARENRDELRRAYGLPSGRFVALFVGRDVAKKGLDIFLAATDPAYDLVAVTDRRPASAPNGVVMLPFMSPGRLQGLLSCVDAFALPSVGEGMPLSLQEALAAGLPTITTPNAGYERYLSPEDVLFVDRDPDAIRRALLRLVAEPELRARLSARGPMVVEQHFGAEQFVGSYEALYEETLAHRRPGEAPDR